MIDALFAEGAAVAVIDDPCEFCGHQKTTTVRRPAVPGDTAGEPERAEDAESAAHAAESGWPRPSELVTVAEIQQRLKTSFAQLLEPDVSGTDPDGFSYRSAAYEIDRRRMFVATVYEMDVTSEGYAEYFRRLMEADPDAFRPVSLVGDDAYLYGSANGLSMRVGTLAVALYVAREDGDGAREDGDGAREVDDDDLLALAKTAVARLKPSDDC